MRGFSRRGPASLRRVLAVLVVAIAVVLGLLIAAAIAGTLTTSRDYRASSQEALARQAAANQVLVTLLNAQTANRTYTLLRRGLDSQAYRDARDRYPGAIARLQRVVAGNEELEQAVAAVDAAAEDWFEEARMQIRLVLQGRVEAAIRRENRGVLDAPFIAFRLAHARLLQEVEEEQAQTLAAADARRRLTLVGIVSAAALALVMVALVSRAVWLRVGGPVDALAGGVRRVAAGRLSEPVPPSTSSARELSELVGGFNAMQRQVLDQRDEAAASARREAAAARREAVQRTERHLWETVQEGLLPRRLAGVPGLRMAARYHPAEQALLVGGDFYDSVALPDGRLAIVVGDISGHGAPSAAQAAGLRFGWRTLVAVNPNPAAVLAALNVQMRGPDQRTEGLFASLCYVLIDPRGPVSYAPAGHEPPFLLGAGGCAPLVPTPASGPLLGIMDEADWPVSRATLPLGGTLVLYTDGLVEARRGGADVFGAERACAVLAAERASALECRVERVIGAARRHEDAPLRDDVTVLAIERPAPLTAAPPRRRPTPSAASRNGQADGAPTSRPRAGESVRA